MVVSVSGTDPYTPQGTADEPRAHLIMEASSSSGNVGTNTWEMLDRQGLTPTATAVDFYRAAVAAYCADQRISRQTHARDSWGREITIHLPVTDLRLWQRAQRTFEELLRFLTGDHWTLELRESAFARPPRREILFSRATPLAAKQVCLLSGGMDSYLGAIDLLAQGTIAYFVSHYGGGTGKRIGKVQDQVAEALGREFPADTSKALGFHVTPRGDLTSEKETSSRSRSILFLGIAVLVASSLGDDAEVVVPENGFISLNVPLTASRLGSHSTRTTHPHTLDLLRRNLESLDIRLQVKNPYSFLTKGEMLAACSRLSFVGRTVGLTMSCAHPVLGRFRGGVGSGFEHCGYCLPCLIRRSSLHHLGWDPVEDYSYDVRRRKPSTEAEKANIFAFRMALQRLQHEPPLPFLLSAGPLECAEGELERYLDVYLRGMHEVGNFLDTSKA